MTWITKLAVRFCGRVGIRSIHFDVILYRYPKLGIPEQYRPCSS